MTHTTLAIKMRYIMHFHGSKGALLPNSICFYVISPEPVGGVWKLKRFCMTCIKLTFKFLSSEFCFQFEFFFNFDFQMH